MKKTIFVALLLIVVLVHTAIAVDDVLCNALRSAIVQTPLPDGLSGKLFSKMDFVSTACENGQAASYDSGTCHGISVLKHTKYI